MSDVTLLAQVLAEALPYIQKYYGKTIVIKYGGSAMISRELREAVIGDVILLSLSSSVAGAKPESGGHPADVKKLLDITGTLWYVVCLPEERAGKSYEPSEETEHAQEPR